MRKYLNFKFILKFLPIVKTILSPVMAMNLLLKNGYNMPVYSVDISQGELETGDNWREVVVFSSLKGQMSNIIIYNRYSPSGYLLQVEAEPSSGEVLIIPEGNQMLSLWRLLVRLEEGGEVIANVIGLSEPLLFGVEQPDIHSSIIISNPNQPSLVLHHIQLSGGWKLIVLFYKSDGLNTKLVAAGIFKNGTLRYKLVNLPVILGSSSLLKMAKEKFEDDEDQITTHSFFPPPDPPGGGGSPSLIPIGKVSISHEEEVVSLW